jgi:hypothetical protein
VCKRNDVQLGTIFIELVPTKLVRCVGNGTEFNYSCLMILFSPTGWKDPKYTSFITRMRNLYVTMYDSLYQEKDNKAQQKNNVVFSILLEEIHQCTTNTWRIPREVVQETEGIENFKEYRHHT